MKTGSDEYWRHRQLSHGSGRFFRKSWRLEQATGRLGTIPGQAGLLGTGFLARTAGSLLLAALLSRELGAAEYGELALFLAVGTGVYYVVGSWALLAIPALGSRTLKDRRPPVAGVYWVSMWLAGGLVLAASALVAPLLSRLGLRTVEPLLLVPFAISMFLLQGWYAVFQATVQAGRIAVLQTAERAVAVGAVSVAIYMFNGGAEASALALIVALIIAAMTGAAAGGLAVVGSPGFQVSYARRILRFSTLVFVMNLASYLVAWVDLLAIAVLRSSIDVGRYALAYQVFTFPVLLASQWVLAALPAYASEATGMRREQRVRLDSVANFAWWWSVAMVLAGGLIGPMFGPVFGSEFTQARGPLMILFAATPALSYYYAIVPLLMASNGVRVVMWVSVTGAVVNGILDFVLTPSLGIWGPAFGTVAQTLLVTAFLLRNVYGSAGLARFARSCVVPTAGIAAFAWTRTPLETAATISAVVLLMIVARPLLVAPAQRVPMS